MNIIVPQHVAEALERQRTGDKWRPYQRKSGSSGLDFARMRRGVVKRRLRAARNLGAI